MRVLEEREQASLTAEAASIKHSDGSLDNSALQRKTKKPRPNRDHALGVEAPRREPHFNPHASLTSRSDAAGSEARVEMIPCSLWDEDPRDVDTYSERLREQLTVYTGDVSLANVSFV
jgi:hypothetical protein